MRIFLSFASADTFLVERLADLLHDTFDSGVEVVHSALQVQEGGIKAGDDWLDWIQERVKASQIIIVLLTPVSASRPWLMWEAGAVSGAGFASEADPLVVPLKFWLGNDEVPPPLRSRQYASGTTLKGIQDLVQTIVQHAEEHGGAGSATLRDEAARQRAIDQYLSAVNGKTRYYDAFLSCPMTSLDGDEAAYAEMREHLIELRDAMTEDGLKVYCAAIDEVEKLEDAFPADVAAEFDLERLRASKHFVLVYPRDTITSCFVEAGYALALGIPSFYFLAKGTRVPAMIEGAPEVINEVRKHEFRKLEEIVKTYKNNPSRVCPRKES